MPRQMEKNRRAQQFSMANTTKRAAERKRNMPQLIRERDLLISY